jgi:excinuclease UvrABC nuclease subunit
LKEFSLKQIDSIPKISGLYYLYEDERLLYIGKAVNIRYRLKQHQVANFWCTEYPSDCHIDYAWNQITRIIIEHINRTLLIPIEKIMIHKLKPILNRQTRTYYFHVDSYLDSINDKGFKDLDDYWKRIRDKQKV